MKVSLWAEIHRLADIDGLSNRSIARKLQCSRKIIKAALLLNEPPENTSKQKKRSSKLDTWKPIIKELLQNYPQLSAIRIGEEIRKQGYSGGQTIIKDYLQQIRDTKKRVYQSVDWQPGEAMQVDWGDCGSVCIGSAQRKVSVFVAALCYSRVLYIEFTLDQKKETFYRSTVNALRYFGGSPRRIIVDNLKAAVVSGHGRTARFHPEYINLCSYYRMQIVACQRRDPESKGIVEAGVRYVKHNALAGRNLDRWEEYSILAKDWLNKVNTRIHRSTEKIPHERITEEELMPLPAIPYDTRCIKQCIVNSHAHVVFETNKYSVPPEAARKPVTLKADEVTVWIYYHDGEIARHSRSYERKVSIIDPAHRLAALSWRKKESKRSIIARFGDLGDEAISFSKGLHRSSHHPTIQIRKLFLLLRLYGRRDFLRALEAATSYQVFEAAYVENLIQQNRRRLRLPSPLPLSPIRKELLEDDLEEPSLEFYDQLIEGENVE